MQNLVMTAFSTPILNYKSRLYTENYIHIADQIVFRRDTNMDTSVDTYILNMPQLKELKVVVERAIESFARDICSIKNNFKFYITNSWYNKHHYRDSIGKHYHDNSIFSGCLYLKTNSESGNIVFHNDSVKDQLFPTNIRFEYNEPNMFNSPSTALSPSSGDIVLFPSQMVHSVESNLSTETRHCIAFNVFVKGSFGTVHRLDL